LSVKLRSLNLRARTINASRSEGIDFAGEGVPWRSQLLLDKRSKTEEIQPATLAPIAPAHEQAEYRRGREAPAHSGASRGLHRANEQCDVILIDANPLPISAQTEYLARVSDVTVLVVKSSATTKHELERSARLLERLDVAGVAVVLNKMNLDRADRDLKRELQRYEQSFRQRCEESKKDSRRDKVRA